MISVQRKNKTHTSQRSSERSVDVLECLAPHQLPRKCMFRRVQLGCWVFLNDHRDHDFLVVMGGCCRVSSEPWLEGFLRRDIGTPPRDLSRSFMYYFGSFKLIAAVTKAIKKKNIIQLIQMSYEQISLKLRVKAVVFYFLEMFI